MDSRFMYAPDPQSWMEYYRGVAKGEIPNGEKKLLTTKYSNMIPIDDVLDRSTTTHHAKYSHLLPDITMISPVEQSVSSRRKRRSLESPSP